MITLQTMRWLGAPAPGGLALPAADAAPTNLYAPRGVYLDQQRLIAVDTGNHRVLIWQQLPVRDHQPADLVLGQPDFTHEGPRAAGRGPANGFHVPTGVTVAEGRLYLADAWHHRVLCWHRFPERSDTPPDSVIGQANLLEIEPNRGGAVGPTTLYWPYGVAWIAGWFYIADTGNRRVLGWRGLPEPTQPPDLILGQPDGWSNAENRGGPPTAHSFRWPHALAGDGTTLYVADAGNHRVLAWTPPPTDDRPADLVLGQTDMQSAFEQPHVPQGAHRLRFPYAVACTADRLCVADTANNRLLVWQPLPRHGAGLPAQAVFGQADFAGSGENRWQAIAPDTLCWPYGLCAHQQWLAIADSGNNRIIIGQWADG
ncbi:MAG TPA: hypothetical protein DEF43_10240 [Chloroflexus aurantiacus]|jgi:hypothetical protein|uniref:NHL repeat containing protein n=1 Tax=Chloroflexus aurantiacus (strain ATCC 29366 / DSM 635 / J-10-fl) TaxID=324602 RepID=A9WK89_CHLAA|nr:NHL repeat-containing protein [Chloroflexus aurantiacus]ABY35967.1 NHL repeat containing protein [Chloroflexus aurantiacus J-10-fl]RMG49402.1 MAG: hypothetical protein D6716_11320 [Chloroflexota bacterium]GIV91520.1 MAG: hypothetical protein KatS3mg056_0229 [Chloroflexus sp.]HBW67520.1 hypothetical protein [Chloroflexus aurantiacus]